MFGFSIAFDFCTSSKIDWPSSWSLVFPWVGRVNGSRLRSLHFRLHEALHGQPRHVMATKPANGQKIKIQPLVGFNKGEMVPTRSSFFQVLKQLLFAWKTDESYNLRRPKWFHFKVMEPLAAGSSGLEARWWFQCFLIFHPYLGKGSQLTNIIFQVGWNHQLVRHLMFWDAQPWRIS